MKFLAFIAGAMLTGAAVAQSATGASQGPTPTDRCKVVLAAAQGAQEHRESEIREQERRAAQRAREASSCLARAGDGIVRAAIPPSLGQIFGAISDPAGYISNATSNAACNVVNAEAGKVARSVSDVNGAVMREGSAADQAFRGGVDEALGGKGQSYGQYTGQSQKKEDDSSYWKTLTCRLYGRC